MAYFRRRGFEATLVAFFYAASAWIVMHIAITVVSTKHPDYHNSVTIIGGRRGAFLFSVLPRLIVKQRRGWERRISLLDSPGERRRGRRFVSRSTGPC
jgi:hypothetical protein